MVDIQGFIAQRDLSVGLSQKENFQEGTDQVHMLEKMAVEVLHSGRRRERDFAKGSFLFFLSK